jgi:hypothetical protein
MRQTPSALRPIIGDCIKLVSPLASMLLVLLVTINNTNLNFRASPLRSPHLPPSSDG